VQEQKLFDDEEQEEYDREAAAEEVLQGVPEAYAPQGSKSVTGRRGGT